MSESSTSNEVININEDHTFEVAVLENKGLVLVDFWAPWCGPCKAISPVLDHLAKEITDVSIVKVNVDDHAELASKYGVRGIPTLILFKAGEIEETKVGSQNKAQLEAWLNNAVNKPAE